jgi:hypothetical protein
VTRGLWYAFTAGSMRVISIANDDIVYQDGGNLRARVFRRRAKGLAGTRIGRRAPGPER